MKRYLISILSMTFFIVLAGVAVAFFLFYKYGSGLPDYKHLADYEPPVVTRLYANDGRLFAEYAHEKRVFIPIEAIPNRLIRTFLAAEDKNYYNHFGIDIPSIIRSAFQNVERMQDNKRPIGASTITQQVARNFLLANIANELSLTRKIKEAILALRLEHSFSKDHILELYLNEIYLGNNSYGVGAAALNYFNKTLDQLTIAEAAFLAGLPKAPSKYHPGKNPELALARRNWVISRMVEEGVITEEQAKEAKNEPINLQKRDKAEVIRADYFAEEVRRNILKNYGENVLYQGGLVVRTTVDPKQQEIAEKALREGLQTYDRRHGWRGPLAQIKIEPDWKENLDKIAKPSGTGNWKLAVVLSVNDTQANIGLSDGEKGIIPFSEMKWARKFISTSAQGPFASSAKEVLKKGNVILVEPLLDQKDRYALRQIPKVGGAIVVIDPHTGRVLAMQGGFDFSVSQYNRATQAYRQPGSAFKPFVYLSALENGCTPSTVIMDSPFAINMGYGLGVWAPKNYGGKFLGPTTLRVGLEKSRNVVTVRLTHDKVGMENVIEIANRFNIDKKMPMQLAMVLGAGETTLLRLTAAYASIVNGGKQVNPFFIDRIQDRKGKTIKMNDPRTCIGCTQAPWSSQELPELIDERLQLTDPATAYQVTSILEGAVRYGTGRIVQRAVGESYPLAGKTGTSNDFYDSWFIGFSPDLVVGVFVGFDGPRSLGDKETGARVAAPIVGAFLKEALKDTPPTPFRTPPGIKLVKVNKGSGARAYQDGPNVITEAFKLDDKVPESGGGGAPQGDIGHHSSGSKKPPSSNTSNEGSGLSGTGGLY